MDDGSLPPWTRHQEEDPEPQVDAQASSANMHSASSFSFGGINSSQDDDTMANGLFEEEDICRVCRENTPDKPLLHPWYITPSIVNRSFHFVLPDSMLLGRSDQSSSQDLS